MAQPDISTLNLDEVFLDSAEMTVDNKGRVGIPEKFMKVIRRICPDNANVVGLTPTPERSIKIMPYSYFARRVTQWGQLDGEKQAERTMLNVLSSCSGLFPLDPQNRIKLNPALMRLCNIQRDVIIVGNVHFMQLFDKLTFERMMEKGLEIFDEAQEKATRKLNETAPVQLILNPFQAGPQAS